MKSILCLFISLFMTLNVIAVSVPSSADFTKKMLAAGYPKEEIEAVVPILTLPNEFEINADFYAEIMVRFYEQYSGLTISKKNSIPETLLTELDAKEQKLLNAIQLTIDMFIDSNPKLEDFNSQPAVLILQNIILISQNSTLFKKLQKLDIYAYLNFFLEQDRYKLGYKSSDYPPDTSIYLNNKSQSKMDVLLISRHLWLKVIYGFKSCVAKPMNEIYFNGLITHVLNLSSEANKATASLEYLLRLNAAKSKSSE